MPGFYVFTEDNSMSLYLPFGEKEPKTTGGGPIIARTTRPKAKTLTEFAGRNEYQISVSYNLSDWATRKGADFERRLRILARMQGQRPGDPEPPQLIVLGDPPGCIEQDYHDAPGHRWWLEDIAEDDGSMRNDSGNRIATSGILTFTEVVIDEGIARLPKHSSKKPPKKYTVKEGDTLSKIAKKFKIKGGWHKLAKLNKIRDPKRIKVGQVIRLS